MKKVIFRSFLALNLLLCSSGLNAQDLINPEPNSEADYYELAGKYLKGEGVQKDEKQAFEWLQKAAAQGHISAQNDLGAMYANGKGVKQDHAEAKKWFELAAEQGHPHAQFNLGLSYDEGSGVKQDYTQARVWYEKAANQGHAEGQSALAYMYLTGHGIKKNYAQALKWFKKAAEQGYAYAQYNLGRMYAEGEGVKKNYAQAIKWFEKAAEQEYVAAQAYLGYLYLNNKNTKEEYTQALNWNQKAIENGADPYTYGNIGLIYENGYSVKKDVAKAMHYYLIGCDKGNDFSCNKYRDLRKSGAIEPSNGFNSQTYFVNAVSEAQKNGKTVENDMQLGGIKAKRDKKVCQILEGTSIKNWVGSVSTISANREGKGVLAIDLGNRIILTTWNNALSDYSSSTLIEPGTTLFENASALKIGDRVKFSGKFVESGKSCVREASLRLSSDVEFPEFIFSFSAIENL